MRIVEAEMVKIEMVGALEEFSYKNDKKCKKSYQYTSYYSNGDSEFFESAPTSSGRSIIEYINCKGDKVRHKTSQVAPVGEKVRIIELKNGWVIDFDPYSRAAIVDYMFIGIVILILLKCFI